MRNILVLADEAEARTLRAQLELEDLTVDNASTAAQGLETYRAADSDLIVLAMPLPDDSGFSFCQQLRADPAGQTVPLLLITRSHSVADLAAVIACGVDSFLRKPYAAEDLIRVVRGLLAGRASAEVSLAGLTLPLRLHKLRARSLVGAALVELARPSQTTAAGPADPAPPLALSSPLVAQERKYRRLVAEAPEAILLLDPGGMVLEVNHRAEKMLARSADDLVGRSYEAFVPSREREHERTRFRQLLHDGSMHLDHFHLERGNGEEIQADFSASVVEVGEDDVLFVIAHDAAQRTLLEEQFRQAQKMEAVGRLAGGVAHDFNNLLTVINGYSEILLNTLGPGDDTRQLVQEIATAGERAATLTKQLLAFSRKQILEPRLLDLNRLVRDLSTMLTRLIGEDIALSVELQTPLAQVKADPGQLEQVLMNLVVNSRDAMPQGGELIIRTANVALDEAYARARPRVQPGWYVQLSVQDTGCGMTEATRAHLFEPFFTTKEPGKGTGLGLATVFGIIDQSGGHIQVDTLPGQGTTFHIYLPATDEAVAPHKPAAAVQAPKPGGSETILLVEDEQGVRALTRDVLQHQGYMVLTATDGREAVLVCGARRDRIDLLVTDVVMPRMGGREFAEWLLGLHPEMKVLYLSGYPDQSLVPRNSMHGAEAAFLQKPFAPSLLAQKIREVLGRKVG